MQVFYCVDDTVKLSRLQCFARVMHICKSFSYLYRFWEQLIMKVDKFLKYICIKLTQNYFYNEFRLFYKIILLKVYI